MKGAVQMIQVAGVSSQSKSISSSDPIEHTIIKRLKDDPTMHSYPAMNDLMFEVKLRKNIILSAKAMNESQAQFADFQHARCSPRYWILTDLGGFIQRPDVQPSDAIQDIYTNSSEYAFECATAILIIYYHAVLHLLGKERFNQNFSNLFLYSWHSDYDLGLNSFGASYFIPGDVVYFNNPDFNPQTSYWRGENAVLLEDETYFGHGVSIKTAEQMIEMLNQSRKPGSTQSAYLMDFVTRPAFAHLARLASFSRTENRAKIQLLIIRHNQASISFNHYAVLLFQAYEAWRKKDYSNPQ